MCVSVIPYSYSIQLLLSKPAKIGTERFQVRLRVVVSAGSDYPGLMWSVARTGHINKLLILFARALTSEAMVGSQEDKQGVDGAETAPT